MPQEDFPEIKVSPSLNRGIDIENLYRIARDVIAERELRDKHARGEISRVEYEAGVNPDFIDELGVCDHCIANAVKRALGDVPAWASKPDGETYSRVDYLLTELGYNVDYF